MAKKKVDAKYAAECRKFLAEVSSQPDVREVSQGVLMKYIEQGTGEVCPRANNVVTVKYRGTLIDGTEFDSNMNDGYPAIMNPPDLHKRVRKAVGFFELDKPSMITEDFSWYQKTLPGMFFFLGIGNTPALHADDFDFDEEILLKGADFFEELAENFQ